MSCQFTILTKTFFLHTEGHESQEFSTGEGFCGWVSIYGNEILFTELKEDLKQKDLSPTHANGWLHNCCCLVTTTMFLMLNSPISDMCPKHVFRWCSYLNIWHFRTEHGGWINEQITVKSLNKFIYLVTRQTNNCGKHQSYLSHVQKPQ